MRPGDKVLVLLLRVLMAWTFLYAASHRVFVPGWSVVGFLDRTKAFHDLFAVFTGPSVAPVISVLVAYGHLLIGMSLLVGLMVRQRRLWHPADACLLAGTHGLSVHRERQ